MEWQQIDECWTEKKNHQCTMEKIYIYNEWTESIETACGYVRGFILTFRSHFFLCLIFRLLETSKLVHSFKSSFPCFVFFCYRTGFFSAYAPHTPFRAGMNGDDFN